jgi:peroxiredoxin
MKRAFVIVLFLCNIWSLAPAQQITLPELKVGDIAPDFSLPYATKDSVGGEDLVLSGLFERSNIILAFYPADWSGGCTKEVCTLRDNFSALSQLKADILAISGDYVYSHHEWAKYHNLPFKLVADHHHDVAKKYGSYNETAGYNKRAVYLIDKHGKIAYIDLKYSVRDTTSFEKLQDALKQLQ